MRRESIWWACAVVTGLASSPAFAQSTTTDCSAVTDDRARLKCYDEQAGRQKGKAATPPAAASVPQASPPPAANAAPVHAPSPRPVRETPAPKLPAAGSSDFGAESIQKPAERDAVKAVERITARVSSVGSWTRGDYRITLEDGQVWEESQHTSGAAPPETGETVTIKRGALGSYFLSRSSGGLALRVRRVH